MKTPIYLDYSSTTPCDERVVKTMLPYFNTFFGNASSRSHQYGWQAEAAVDKARQQIANLADAEAQEIIFTSGATEACNLALRGVAEMYASKGNHIITTAIEHKAVLDTCKTLEKKNIEITYLNVSEEGFINLDELKAAIRPETILIAVMYANNETGVIQPVKEIGKIAKQNNILFFCDASQAFGKIPLNVQEDGIDLMAISAHKMYGPKGAGALYLRRKNPRVRIMPQITGGSQERDIRSGTLNVPGIVGLGEACAICNNEMQKDDERLSALRDKLQAGLLQIDGAIINGNLTSRLPHVLSISFKGHTSSSLLAKLNKSLAISSGSACTSGSLDPSYVLKAMGLEDSIAKAALRFSLGRFTTEAEIDFAIKEVRNAVKSA